MGNAELIKGARVEKQCSAPETRQPLRAISSNDNHKFLCRKSRSAAFTVNDFLPPTDRFKCKQRLNDCVPASAFFRLAFPIDLLISH